MSPRAMVTGATGMLGSYVTRALTAEGWTVRALVRSPGPCAWLEAAGVRCVAGDLEDAASLRTAARGVDVVFHTAAFIGTGADWAGFRDANVRGTANVLDAARRAGARLVHVSSTAVYGRARFRDRPTVETDPLPDLPPHDVYGRSKQEAERVVLQAHRSGSAWVTVVRPPVMFGRRDRQFVPRIGPVLRRGLFPLISGGRTTLTLVHAGRVAEGMLAAAVTEGARGRTFLLADDGPLTVRALVKAAEAGLERRILAPTVPYAVGRAGMAGLAVALKVAGRGDLARHARGTLEMLTRDNPFSSELAREVLGWSSCPDPGGALLDAFRWWHLHAGPRGAKGGP